MRFLIDNALSPKVADALRKAGHDAVHLRDYGIQDEVDSVIFERAAAEDRILVSADTDFGLILSKRSAKKPSVMLFREDASRIPAAQTKLLLENLSKIKEDLENGAIVVFDGNRIRIRSLPI